MSVFTHLQASACPVYRIAAHETNKFVMLVDPLIEHTGFIQVLEIFDVGGFTSPNQHRAAEEVFVVLHGHGEAAWATLRCTSNLARCCCCGPAIRMRCATRAPPVCTA